MSKLYNITEKETQPVTYNHFNGTKDEILARFVISEICKGWPLYRDASEWTNYRSMFTKNGARIWTSWSGGRDIDDFIRVSKEGRANGDFIMHRENGTLVDLNLAKERAIGKMKATITQRFNFDGVEFDVECDCRFIFWLLIEDGEWKVKYNRLFYEKDKMIAVDGKTVPTFPKEELEKYPQGYRYLGVAQSKLGHPIEPQLPNMNNEPFYKMYDAMAAWLEGKDIDLEF